MRDRIRLLCRNANKRTSDNIATIEYAITLRRTLDFEKTTGHRSRDKLTKMVTAGFDACSDESSGFGRGYVNLFDNAPGPQQT